MGTAGTCTFVWLFVTALAVLWTPLLCSGCPAQPTYQTEPRVFKLNDTHPDYHLTLATECGPGVRVEVATSSSCRWLINGTQVSSNQYYAHPDKDFILLQPFEQILGHSTVTCIISRTRRYNFMIGDVTGNPDPSPSLTVGPSTTSNVASDSPPPPTSPSEATGSAVDQTTPPGDHTNIPSSTSSHTPGETPSESPPIVETTSPSPTPEVTDKSGGSISTAELVLLVAGVLIGLFVAFIIIIFIIWCLRRKRRHNHGNTEEQNDLHTADGGGTATGGSVTPGEERLHPDSDVEMQTRGNGPNGELEEAVQESEFPSVLVKVVDSCNGSGASRGHDTASDVDVHRSTEDTQPIPETQEPLLTSASSFKVSEKNLRERGYEITSNVQFFIKSLKVFNSCLADPPHSSTQSSGYDMYMYDEADGISYSEEEVVITRPPQEETVRSSSLPLQPPLSPPMPSNPLPSSPPPSTPSSSLSSSTSSTTYCSSGDSGVDMAGVDTEDGTCTENTEWEDTALVTDGIEESTKEDMSTGQEVITGHEMNQDQKDEDEIVGGDSTIIHKKCIRMRATGAPARKERLGDVVIPRFGSSSPLMCTPPSKWKSLPFKSDAGIELVHGFIQLPTFNNTREGFCC